MRPSDDNVEEGHLSSAFDITCRAWQVRGRFAVRMAVLTSVVATIWCSVHALWLSVTGQLSFRSPGTVLMSEAGGHCRAEAQPPFGVILL